MKYILILVLGLLLQTSAMCAETEDETPTEQKYQIRGKWVEFIRDPSQHLTLSSSCRDKKCQAFKALSEASLKGLDEKLVGGAQPGAVVCRQKLHAELQTGKDEDGNETGFCKFKDGSLVGTGTISYYAEHAKK